MLRALASLWRRLRHAPRVLFIDDFLPDPRVGAGVPRALRFAQAILAAGASLTLLSTTKDPDGGEGQSVLSGAKVATGYGRDGIVRFLSDHKGKFDVIVISRPHNMAALRAAGSLFEDGSAVPVIYDSEAIFAIRDARRRELLGLPSTPELTVREIERELALAKGARMISVIDAATEAAFKSAGYDDVRVLGHAVESQPTAQRFEQREGFLFVGPAYADDTPNSDSIVWFADHVLPRIHQSMGRAVPLTLVGHQQSPAVGARIKNAVCSRGALKDLTESYGAARVFVAPTRFSSGLPLKVYDAAAHGLPVVLTPLLAEQLDWRHEKEALVAQSPDDFAAQCVRLYNDRNLWVEIRKSALARVARDCDPPHFNRIVREMLIHAVGRG